MSPQKTPHVVKVSPSEVWHLLAALVLTDCPRCQRLSGRLKTAVCDWGVPIRTVALVLHPMSWTRRRRGQLGTTSARAKPKVSKAPRRQTSSST
jgi:hypothetical protein